MANARDTLTKFEVKVLRLTRGLHGPEVQAARRLEQRGLTVLDTDFRAGRQVWWHRRTPAGDDAARGGSRVRPLPHAALASERPAFTCRWDEITPADAERSTMNDYESVAEDFVSKHLHDSGGGDVHVVIVRSPSGDERRMRVDVSTSFTSRRL